MVHEADGCIEKSLDATLYNVVEHGTSDDVSQQSSVPSSESEQLQDKDVPGSPSVYENVPQDQTNGRTITEKTNPGL